MQGRFYRLTVASEESAIRFHCCKTRRGAAAERAPGNSCAQMLALARGGSQPRKIPLAGGTVPVTPAVSSLRRGLLLPLGWKYLLAMTPHLFLSRIRTPPPARRTGWGQAPEPQRRCPGSSPLQSGVCTAGPASCLLLPLQLDNDASFPVAGTPPRSSPTRQGFQKTRSAANLSFIVPTPRNGAWERMPVMRLQLQRAVRHWRRHRSFLRGKKIGQKLPM